MDKTTVIIIAVVAVGGIVLYASQRPTQPTIPNNPNQNNYNEVPWYQSLIAGLTAGAIVGARTPVQEVVVKRNVDVQARNNADSGVPSNPTTATQRTV